MGILDSFERRLESLVNRAFARTFKSSVQPLEIAAALRRELDTRAAVVSRDRILVPNRFTVRLSPIDHDAVAKVGPALVDELTSIVQKHATRQRYAFAGAVTIRLERDASVSQGVIAVESDSVQGDVAWTPVLDIAGQRFPITHSRTILGRGSEADVSIPDDAASRAHLEILWDGKRGQVRDLGSTNGSYLDGERLSRAMPLQPDSVIRVGRTSIVFRVLAQSAGVDQFADLRHPRTS